MSTGRRKAWLFLIGAGGLVATNSVDGDVYLYENNLCPGIGGPGQASARVIETTRISSPLPNMHGGTTDATLLAG